MNPEFSIFESQFGYKPQALYPNILHSLPQDKLESIAQQSSVLIKKLGDKTMFQYSPIVLIDFMKAGLALPVVDSTEECNVVSFVKALPWFPRRDSALGRRGSHND